MIYLLTFTFFILQCIDWYTTITILKGGGYEQNPVMAFAFRHVNPSLALGIKAVLLTVLGYFIGTIIPLLLILLIILYVWVAYHNGKSLWT